LLVIYKKDDDYAIKRFIKSADELVL
jgi:hypothetical protein